MFCCARVLHMSFKSFIVFIFYGLFSFLIGSVIGWWIDFSAPQMLLSREWIPFIKHGAKPSNQKCNTSSLSTSDSDRLTKISKSQLFAGWPMLSHLGTATQNVFWDDVLLFPAKWRLNVLFIWTLAHYESTATKKVKFWCDVVVM